MKSVTTKRIAGGLAMAGIAGVAGYMLVRPKLLDWGARQDEIERASRPRLPYPIWHQRKTVAPRLSDADKILPLS